MRTPRWSSRSAGGLTACRSRSSSPHVASRCLRSKTLGRRINDMLAIVEQQQHPIVSKGSDKGGKRIFGDYLQTEHGRNRARHQAGVAEGCQIDLPDAVFVVGG